MKIVAYDAGRATLLLPLEEVLPLDGYDSREVLDNITDRYNFSTGPDYSMPREKLQKAGFNFELGTFIFNGKAIEIGRLSVFSDGVVAVSAKTDYAEALIDDLMAWLQADMGFRSPLRPTRKLFLSNVVFDLEIGVEGLIKKHSEMANLLGKVASKYFPNAPVPRLSRIDIDFDPEDHQSSIQMPGLVIERRGGVPFEQERYFSSAPLRTHEHEAVLESIEKLMR